MVSVYTIDGEVTLDTAPFDSAIGKLVEKLENLQNGLKGLGINTQNFTNELSVADKEMEDLANDTTTFSERLGNVTSETGVLNNEMGSLNQMINEAVSSTSVLQNETGVLSSNVSSLKGEVEQTVSAVSQVNNEFNSMRYYIDLAKAEAQGLAQIHQINQQKIVDEGIALVEETNRINQQVDILRMKEQQLEANATIQEEIIARIERETRMREKLRQETIEGYQLGLTYLEQMHQAEVQLYDDIVRRYEAQGQLATTVAEQLLQLEQINAQDERDIAILDEQLALREEIIALTREGTAESIKQAEALMKQVEGGTEIATVLEEEIAMEKERLSLIEEENVLLNEQGAIQKKNTTTSSRVNQLDRGSNLPRRIGSMALTMFGYNEIMDIYEKTMGHINAVSQRDYFADRIGMDTKALNNFKSAIAGYQKQYQKLDMTVVGANALETASKYKVSTDNLDELTEVMAIYGSEFVKQGRTQEDSILAINDALDGELRRLKEVGIGQQELKDTGLWNGDESDKTGMLLALLKIAEDRGYSQTAKDITNLSDAITTLEVKLAIDLAQAFKFLEPILVEVGKDLVKLLELFEKLSDVIKKGWSDFGYWLNDTFGKGSTDKLVAHTTKGLGALITAIIGFVVVKKIATSLIGAWGNLMRVLGKTESIDKATESVGNFEKTTTGGTMGDTKGGGFKEEFKKGFQGTGENLGKMAKIFLEVATAIAMAFAIIEEAILLISAVGYTYDALKPQFDSGVEFIQEFGVWIWGASAVLIGAMAIMSRIPVDTSMITQGFTKVAVGLALAMALVAEAIFLLNAPLLAIASLGAVRNWQRENIDSGLEVIREMGNILSSDINDTLGFFIIAFIGASVILGLVPEAFLPLAVGMALSIALVTEAIFLLNAPLLAIASLGVMSNAIGEDSINKGVQTIELIARCLIALQPAVSSLLMVDLAVFGIQLVDWGNKLLSGGKDGLTALVQDILPTLSSFLTSFNQLTFEDVKTEKIQQIVNFANQMPPLFNAIQKVNQTLGTSDMLGNIGGAVGGSVSGSIGMGLKGKLNQLYNDVKDVMDFATKVSGLNTGGDVQLGAVQQVSQVITQLNAKLKLMSATISTASRNIRTSSKAMGNAITQGFREGSVNFGAEVIKTIASGVTEVQKRYNTMMSGGKALGNKLVSGWNAHTPKLKTATANEVYYALQELEKRKDQFYNKGKLLGQEATRGYEDGLDMHSPGRIARATAMEMQYTLQAIDNNKRAMYLGGYSLGQALVSGYNSSGNIRTDISTLARKGVTGSELTQNTKKIVPNNANSKSKVLMPIFNFDMSGATIIGIDDLNARIEQGVDNAMVKWHSSDGAVGY